MKKKLINLNESDKKKIKKIIKKLSIKDIVKDFFEEKNVSKKKFTIIVYF